MFTVSVIGPLINGTYVRHSAADAIAKAKEFTDGVNVSITDPLGHVWMPSEFDVLLSRWPQQKT